MLGWRIFDHLAPHARTDGFDPLGGTGGLHRSGRWHHRGQPVLYTSSSPSLAVLEVLVHETSASFREKTLISIELEDDTELLTPHNLVRLLADAPAGRPEQLTRDYGTKWLTEHRSLALRVPSIVMPYETNLIINPLHPRARSLRPRTRDIVSLDQRLLRSLGER